MKVSLKMDKFRHGLSPKYVPSWEQEYKRVREFVNIDCANGSIPGAQKWHHSKNSWTNGKVPLESGNSIVVAHGTTPHGPRAYFDFNPGLLHESGLKNLNVVLDECLSGGILDFLQYGSVSSVEFACDVVGEEYADYIFVDHLLHTSNSAYEAAGTVYLGSKAGTRQAICYDKRKQLWNVKKIDIGHALLRIEARIRPTQRQLYATLPLAKNPFASLLVIDRHLLAQSKLSIAGGKFRKAVLDGKYDPNVAFRVAAPEGYAARKKLENELRSLAPNWWDAKLIWDMAPTTLSLLH